MSDASNRPSTGDEDTQRLYAALSWEAGGRRKRLGLTYSMIVHLAAFLPLLWSTVLPTKKSPPPTLILSRIEFQPKTSSAPARTASAPNPLTVPSTPTPIDDAEEALAQLSVELTATKLRYARDDGNLLPKLVKKWNGDLALVKRGDQEYAEYLFKSPDWRLVSGPVSIRERYMISMNPPEAWRIFGELESRNGIPRGKFQGAALFDYDYRNCIRNAIRTNAISNHKFGKVSSAFLKFTLDDDPCGVVALEVDLAPKAGR